ncbi:hypothetical protein NBRC110019_31390 [Neptunitalea chrysea]|uniref:RteC protein n=1 Tax=Neptunitalea chrysea TaxID=1647581 RepID=A0A9W6EX05_9FLAO|nr:RteC domain-containing protein [Neptunitalea chrysea]GLB54098.1 hypothetical protein NBRC110019_31390 [Neptunitalea chrysea]
MNEKAKLKIEKALYAFKESIQEIERSDLSVIINTSKGIQISRDCLHQLRLIVRANQFDSIQEEIDFFKEQKPFVYGRLKFFVKIHKSILERPKTSIERQRKFIDQQLEEIDRRRKAFLDFEKYYLQKETKLDKYYFVRGKDSSELISDTSHYYTDPEFSTSHDNMVAQIIASELLINHFNSELHYLRRKELQPFAENPSIMTLEDLEWTASKTDLVELIYALQASGAIQNGNAEIKQMATICEKIFSIDLGNFYRTYLEIRERKMDRSRFIKHLKKSLDQKMENDDQKY